MPWKKDEEKHLAMHEKGNPIWLNETGDEKSVDYQAMSKSLSDANRESAKRKDQIKALEEKLAPFGDLTADDFLTLKTQAEKDRAIVASLPEKDQQVEERIAAQVKAATEPLKNELKKINEEKAAAELRLQRETIANAFSRSAFMAEKIHAKGRAAFTDIFAKQFSIKDGKLVATDFAGNVIYSGDGQGPADFEEALAKLLEEHPSKELFLAGKDSDGGGSDQGKPSKDQGAKIKAKSLKDCTTDDERLAYLRSIKAEDTAK